jgi:hypothetical protein
MKVNVNINVNANVLFLTVQAPFKHPVERKTELEMYSRCNDSGAFARI